MVDDGDRVSFPVPLYVVAASLGPEGSVVQPAFVEGPPEGTFDEALLPALAGIWYAMHLPKSRFETLDLPFKGVQDQVTTTRSHAIALIPDDLLGKPRLMKRLVAPFEPTLIVASRESLSTAQSASKACGFTLPPVALDELDQDLLTKHWHGLAQAWAKDWMPGVSLDETALIWSWPPSPDGSLLSLQRIRRMMGDAFETLPEFEGPFWSAARTRHSRVHLDAIVALGDDGLNKTPDHEAFQGAVRFASDTTRTKLALSLSGTAPRYKKLAAGQLKGSEPVVFRDKYPEVSTLLVTHAATADDSMGLVLDDVLTPQMFQCLAELESHWQGPPRPRGVRRILSRLDKAAEHLWTEPLIAAVRSASGIEAFTDFPLGLLTMPGDTSPLSTRLPISYRSVNPLTRALQFELNPPTTRDLSKGFRVLIAECISDRDPVGRLSRMAWRAVETEMSAGGFPVEVSTTETPSRAALRAAIAETQPDILVLSAHGFVIPESNVAGVVIGEETSLGDDLGPMPPLVILSACHTSPRGSGFVNVGDLLIRAGADAVLSTLVPVDVRHNAQLVARLFRYLALVVSGDSGYSMQTVMDVWHEVQNLNVIIDLTYGNNRLAEWAFSGSPEASPVGRFMAGPHGLRRGHLYADAEDRLIAIATEMGDEQRVRSWLNSPGYLPESLMYTMLGKPQNLLLG